ncbi:hypothetical protein [Longispora urticae]
MDEAFRRFFLHRKVDVSGVSGTGRVAEGVQFSDRRVVVQWLVPGQPKSTVLWGSVDEAMQIHGHNGATELVWLDL